MFEPSMPSHSSRLIPPNDQSWHLFSTSLRWSPLLVIRQCYLESYHTYLLFVFLTSDLHKQACHCFLDQKYLWVWSGCVLKLYPVCDWLNNGHHSLNSWWSCSCPTAEAVRDSEIMGQKGESGKTPNNGLNGSVNAMCWEKECEVFSITEDKRVN